MSAGDPPPGSLRATPRLSRWLRRVGRNRRDHPRQGRDWAGILTTLAQIAADELDVALAHIRLRPATTVASPNEDVTAGSLSVQECGLAVRTACAAARGLFLTAAASRFGVPVEALTVEDGVIAGPGNARTSYAELAETVTLSVDVTAPVPAKPASARRIAGTPAARLDDARQGLRRTAVSPRPPPAACCTGAWSGRPRLARSCRGR